jgi:hypothetical protein
MHDVAGLELGVTKNLMFGLDDLAGVVDPRDSGRDRAGHVDRGVAAIHFPQEAAAGATPVNVISDDLAGIY